MLLLQVAYNIILPILLIVCLGVIMERHFAISPRPVSSVAFYIFIPALIISGFAQSDLQGEEIGLILIFEVILSFVMALLGWGVTWLFQFDRKVSSALMLTVVFINGGNYGLAVADFAFGAGGLQRGVIFFIATAITGNTLGIFLASRGTASIWQSLRNILLVPLPYAIMVGLIINFGHIALPLPLDRAVTLLGQAAVPTMLVILGMQLSRTSFKGQLKPILLATGLRLVLSPLCALPLLAMMGFTGLSWQVMLLMSGLPTAVSTTILATEFGSDAEFISAVVLISTLGSILTLTILLTLIL